MLAGETAANAAGMLLGRSLNVVEQGTMARWVDGFEGAVYLMSVVPQVASLTLAHELRLFLSGEGLDEAAEGGGRRRAPGRRALRQDKYALRLDLHAMGDDSLACREDKFTLGVARPDRGVAARPGPAAGTVFFTAPPGQILASIVAVVAETA
eukprot:971999-Prymnesium_polylepis.1